MMMEPSKQILMNDQPKNHSHQNRSSSLYSLFHLNPNPINGNIEYSTTDSTTIKFDGKFVQHFRSILNLTIQQLENRISSKLLIDVPPVEASSPSCSPSIPSLLKNFEKINSSIVCLIGIAERLSKAHFENNKHLNSFDLITKLFRYHSNLDDRDETIKEIDKAFRSKRSSWNNLMIYSNRSNDHNSPLTIHLNNDFFSFIHWPLINQLSHKLYHHRYPNLNRRNSLKRIESIVENVIHEMIESQFLIRLVESMRDLGFEERKLASIILTNSMIIESNDRTIIIEYLCDRNNPILWILLCSYEYNQTNLTLHCGRILRFSSQFESILRGKFFERKFLSKFFHLVHRFNEYKFDVSMDIFFTLKTILTKQKLMVIKILTSFDDFKQSEFQTIKHRDRYNDTMIGEYLRKLLIDLLGKQSKRTDNYVLQRQTLELLFDLFAFTDIETCFEYNSNINNNNNNNNNNFEDSDEMEKLLNDFRRFQKDFFDDDQFTSFIVRLFLKPILQIQLRSLQLLNHFVLIGSPISNRSLIEFYQSSQSNRSQHRNRHHRKIRKARNSADDDEDYDSEDGDDEAKKNFSNEINRIFDENQINLLMAKIFSEINSNENTNKNLSVGCYNRSNSTAILEQINALIRTLLIECLRINSRKFRKLIPLLDRLLLEIESRSKSSDQIRLDPIIRFQSAGS